MKSSRISKDQWLAMAMLELEAGGIESVRIDVMAKKLSVSRSGFYWHFKDRDDLRRQLLDYWVHEYTEVITSNSLLIQAPPMKRLKMIISLIEQNDLGKYDMAFRAWAKYDEKAAVIVRQVTENRLNFIRTLFSEIGIKGDELELRARLFVCYHTWESSTFEALSKTKSTRLRNKMLQHFVRK